MVRDDLSEASEILEAASGDVDDAEVRERLREQATQLGRLAEQDRDPDHGRLARHQRALDDITADVDESVAARIDEADERINAFRETIEGV